RRTCPLGQRRRRRAARPGHRDRLALADARAMSVPAMRALAATVLAATALPTIALAATLLAVRAPPTCPTRHVLRAILGSAARALPTCPTRHVLRAMRIPGALLALALVGCGAAPGVHAEPRALVFTPAVDRQ